MKIDYGKKYKALRDLYSNGGTERKFTMGDVYECNHSRFLTNDCGFIHRINEGSWAEFFEEAPILVEEVNLAFEEFIATTNLPLLNKQKQELKQYVAHLESEDFDGLLKWLDSFQDMLVEGYKMNPKNVYYWEGDEDE